MARFLLVYVPDSAKEMTMNAIEIKEARHGVCFWCRFEYDLGTFKRTRYLADEEYERLSKDPDVSHDCCVKCAELIKVRCENYKTERGTPVVCRHCHHEIGGGCTLGRPLTDAEYALLPLDKHGDRGLGCCNVCQDKINALDREDALAVKVHLILASAELGD